MDTERSPEERLLALAATQLGLFTLGQALECGLTRAVVRNRLSRGVWTRVRRGVFAVAGHPSDPAASHMAAVLAAGATARSSHRAAAWGWRMTPYSQKAEVTITDGHEVDLPDVRIHRTQATLLAPVLVCGVPSTTAAETLLDLGAVRSVEDVRKALDRSIANRILTPMDALAELERRGGAGIRGTAKLRALLDDAGVSGSHPPSVLEAKTRRLINKAGVPQPQCEMVAGPDGEYHLDFPWPEVMLVVEVNGWEYHSSYKAFHHGMTRQNTLTLDGYSFLNYSWSHVTKTPATVIREIAAAYQARFRMTSAGLWLPDNRNPAKNPRRAG